MMYGLTTLGKMNRLILPLTLLTHLIPVILITEWIQPIGCSYSPNNPVSIPPLDLCSSCKGDNSSCRVVAGIFTRPQLTVGYNVVAHIPRGACNINISEIRNSPNHLALRRKDGSYLFNGDFRLSYSGEYDLPPSTKFTYKRQDLTSPEFILSHGGALEEPLDLVVLYQHPNPGIRYEYTLPSSSWKDSPTIPLVQDPLRGTRGRNGAGTSYYHHQLRQPLAATARSASYISPDPTSLSSSSLQKLPQPILNLYNTVSAFPVKDTNLIGAGGLASPGLYPAASDSSSLSSAYGHNNGANSHNNQYHHHHHQRHLRRRNHVGSGSDSSTHKHAVSSGSSFASSAVSMDKKFYWETATFTNCTEPCGGGTQRSIVRCVRGTTGSAVPDRRCAPEEKPPIQVIRCNLKPCPAEWVIGDWSNCLGECGLGYMARDVHCQQRVSPTLTMRVAEGACLQQKPEARVSCALKPCNEWKTSEWSQCSTHCGNGIRKRTVTCVGPIGDQLFLEECDQAEKPGVLTPCNMGPCEGVSWFVSEWSPECSQRCGGGIQTRHVVCSGLHTHRHVELDKYNETSSFQNENNINYYSYEHHHHRKNGSVRLASELETDLIEEDEENDLKRYKRNSIVESSGDDEGNDLPSTRSVYAFERSKDHDGAEFFCDDSQKPQQERECFSDRGCGDPVWFTGDWGECSTPCGEGIRTRQVLCVVFTRGRFKIVSNEGYCSTDNKPSEKEGCESRKQCLPRWFATEWSECSALCGGGIQKRSVSCRAGNWSRSSSLCSDGDRPIEKRSCNEDKCTLVPVNSTTPSEIANDDGNQVKDKPNAIEKEESKNETFSVKESESNYTSSFLHPAIEEGDELDCKDEYRNCALVVQARLCRLLYYRSACCHSCFFL